MNTDADDSSTIEANSFRFTLRTLLAVFWVAAALVVTGKFDGGTVVYTGIPVALLGFVLINGTRSNPWLRRIVMGWAMLGLWNCYGCPRMSCPIELPSSATNLYVENGGGFTGWHHEVRFQAPVEDCLATAERIQREIASKHQLSINPPEIIDLGKGLLPNKDDYLQFDNWWMQVKTIRKGFYFQPSGFLMPRMWIDTERGIFYLYSSV